MKFDIDMMVKNTNRIFMKGTSQSFAFILLAYIFWLIPNSTYAANPLKYTQDIKLESFISKQHSSIYIVGGKPVVYGETNPLILFVDANDTSILYNKQTEFASIEVIQVHMRSTENESIKIDKARLQAFTLLKYILFVYEYPVCGNGKDESCLEFKTSELVKNTPLVEEDDVRIFYSLSIPQ